MEIASIESITRQADKQCESIFELWNGGDRDRYRIDLDVLMFFIRNPSAIESPSSTAMRISRPIDQVNDSVTRLLLHALLQLKGTLWRDVYVSLTDDPEMLTQIRRFRKNYLFTRENLNKLKAIPGEKQRH